MKYMYLMLICLSQLLHTFLAHIHDYRTYVCYLAPCDTGQQILILVTWKFPWKEKMKICVEEYYKCTIFCVLVFFFCPFVFIIQKTGTSHWNRISSDHSEQPAVRLTLSLWWMLSSCCTEAQSKSLSTLSAVSLIVTIYMGKCPWRIKGKEKVSSTHCGMIKNT